MTAGAGVDRDALGLQNALDAVVSGGTADTADMALVARAVVTAALARTDSVGCHRRSDGVVQGDNDRVITARLDRDTGNLLVSSTVPAGDVAAV
ncbi:MAG: hypothetical protein INR72_14405 [Williamsia herbipolensis]|nr:hypothetical protein [Williamsia herbipolensis]